MWLTFLAIVGAALALRGGQLGPAVGYLREANKTLEQENVALRAQLRERDRQLIESQAKTDLAPMQAALLTAMHSHEERASGRFDKTCTILDLIAERLGHNGE